MYIRLLVMNVAPGLYDLALQIGHFASDGVRILKRQNLSEVENFVWSLANADAIEINGREIPLDASQIAVITTDAAVANLNFGGSYSLN